MTELAPKSNAGLDESPDYSWEKLESVFIHATDLPQEKRKQYVDAECEGQPELRDQVMKMLGAHDSSFQYVAEAQLGRSDFEAPGPIDYVGKTIGSYTLDSILGQGGMGQVYLGVRSDGEFEHRVAIKVVRPELVSKNILDRFRSERQILARLNHPNIAKLLDGGVTEWGAPYLVMEYVSGDDLLTYAAEKNLDLDARIEMFSTVCEAVQHAHQNLIVHRDLKPSNIRVGDDGTVKLLDFGIAKLIDEDLADRPEQTIAGLQFLTPAYAAPEQVTSEPITTATDVYSLGMVLYELLSGAKPYDLQGATRRQVEDLVCDRVPPKPSVQAEVGLARGLSGDLDDIVMKALRKEPGRRYSGAQLFSQDLILFRDGLPVSASSGQVGYRLKKFVRRNVGVLSVTGVSALILTALAIYYTSNLREQRDIANSERSSAEATTGYLVNMIESADPFKGGSSIDSVSVRQVLESGIRRLDDELAEQPLVKARILNALGDVYNSLAEADTAISLIERGIAIRELLLPPDHPDLADSYGSKAVHRAYGGNFQEAADLLRRTLDIQLAAFGTESERVDVSMNNLAAVLTYLGELDEAEKYNRETLALRRRLHDGDHIQTSNSLNNLSSVLTRQGRHEEALIFLNEAVEMQSRLLPPGDAALTISLYNLGDAFRRQNQFAKADSLLQVVLEIEQVALGKEHPDVAVTLRLLGLNHEGADELDKALAYFDRVDHIVSLKLSTGHADRLKNLRDRGRIHRYKGSLSNAKPLHEEALRLSMSGTSPMEIAHSAQELARDNYLMNDFQMALDLSRQSIDAAETMWKPDHENVLGSTEILGASLVASGVDPDSGMTHLDHVFKTASRRGYQRRAASTGAFILDFARRGIPTPSDTLVVLAFLADHHQPIRI